MINGFLAKKMTIGHQEREHEFDLLVDEFFSNGKSHKNWQESNGELKWKNCNENLFEKCIHQILITYSKHFEEIIEPHLISNRAEHSVMNGSLFIVSENE